jgi:hypothetical protein
MARALFAPRFLGVALWLVTSGVLLAEPSLNSLAPTGLQRGTEVEWTLSGSNLESAQELLFYSPGVTVKSLTPASDNQVKAVVTIAADCRLGIHALRLRSADGVSDLRTFSVGHLPEVAEVEPNNDFAQPQVVPLGSTVSGIIQNEDVDYFAVELKKDQRLMVELVGLRLGYTFFDPYVAILNAKRFELARSDDAALLRQDCLCSLVAPEDGKYIIQVRETSFGGNGASFYRLHIGDLPRPTAVYPAGGKPGEKLPVKWIGDARGEFAGEITLPTEGSETAEVFAEDSAGIAPSPNVVRVVDLANSLEIEPNNALPQATLAGGSPLALNGIIQEDGDVDFFKFSAKKGEQLDVRVYARNPLRSPLDSVLTIHNAQGGGIANNDDTGGPDSYIRFNPPADGEYLISVRDQLGSGGPDYVYRVELATVKPALTMRLPERRQYVATTLTVPRNNRMALMVEAQRQNFGGDLNLTFAGLPGGISFEAQPMPAAASQIPVLFTAPADAPLSGALVDVIGKPADASLPIVGRLNQRSMLVRGQNNVDVWGHDADRMAAVLTEEIPFQLEIVQPKAPLVRNGSLGLKIVAKRAPDFTAPISVRMLYNPPGVASSGNITIAENETEAIIPLTANGGAAIGDWKICVVGRSGGRGRGGNRGGGDAASCSTQLANLTIADQYYKLAFEKSAVEQGKETEVVVKVEKLRDFEGTGKVELVGLPANTTSTPLEFTKDTTELVFKVVTSAEAKPGKFPSLVCVTTFQVEGETVTHTLGTGELRIDAPLPPKPAAPMAAAQPMPMPMAEAAPMKRLSRLEQLRLDKAQQEKK